MKDIGQKTICLDCRKETPGDSTVVFPTLCRACLAKRRRKMDKAKPGPYRNGIRP